MSYSTFTTATAGTPPPDPRKHVKYTQGMVLGVDDFTQEFAYLSNRDQWLARDTIGYVTVSGLQVTIEADGDTIAVSPGVAINPRGQFIRVTPRQCARLSAWLQLPDTQQRLGNAASFTAYVTLCYRDCPVDDLPIPGEPCRCDTETMKPSRIIDDFRLELTLTPPPQLEEEVVRSFVSWLRRIEIDDESPNGNLEAFLQAIRDEFTLVGSPPTSPSELPPILPFESPPLGLRIPRSEACEWMRAAMRLWVTELRPLWQAQCAPQRACGCSGPCGCHGTGTVPDDMACECLLLSEVAITRSGGSVTATLNDEHRPFLVHLRMLQELLMCGPCVCGGDAEELIGSPPDGAAPGDSVSAENLFTQFGTTPDAGSSPGFARADHTHGLPPDPIPPHNTNAGAHRNLRMGDVVIPEPPSSDVRGTAEHNLVVGLQSVPISNAVLGAPENGFVLTYRSGLNQWAAEPGAGGTAFRVTSGLVIFRAVSPDQIRFSPPIPHGFNDQLVMIRLGLEEAAIDLVEDVDPLVGLQLEMAPPHMLAIYPNAASQFIVTIRDGRPRGQGERRDWSIRWWCVPVTERRPNVEARADQAIPREIILGMLPAGGITIAALATRLGVSAADIQPVVNRLRTDRLIRVVRGQILPPL